MQLPIVSGRPMSLKSGTSIERVAYSVIIAAVVVCFLYFGREILVPLALASLLSFVLWPVIKSFRRWKFGRVGSVLAAVVLMLASVAVLGYLLTSQIGNLLTELPRYESNLREKVRSIKGASTPGVLEKAADTIQGIQNEIKKTAPPADPVLTPTPLVPDGVAPAAAPVTGDAAHPVVVEVKEAAPSFRQTYEDIVKPILSPIMTLALVILFLIFILLEREDLRDRLLRIAGDSDLKRSTLAMDDAAERLSKFFLTQLLLNVGFGVVIGVGLALIGVPSPVLWGIVAALMRFVPYIGSVLSGIMPVALAAAVDPSWSMFLATLALFVITEPIAGQVVEPVLYGQNTGISPVAVVVSALFWTLLWGPVGLVLSTPLTVCLVVLGKHVPALEFIAVLLGDEPALAPEQRLYQRLLAEDAAEGAALAEEQLKSTGLTTFYDDVAMKSLKLAHIDVARGRLPRDEQGDLLATMRDVATEIDDYPLQHVAAAKEPEPESAATSMQPTTGQVASKVMCVSARGILDEAAAHLLAQLLGKEHVEAVVLDRAATAKLNRGGASETADAICVSFFGDDNPFHVRYLVRTLRRVAPNTPVIVGFWMLRDDPAKIEDWKNRSGADYATGSLGDAMQLCFQAVGRAKAETIATVKTKQVA